MILWKHKLLFGSFLFCLLLFLLKYRFVAWIIEKKIFCYSIDLEKDRNWVYKDNNWKKKLHLMQKDKQQNKKNATDFNLAQTNQKELI